MYINPEKTKAQKNSSDFVCLFCFQPQSLILYTHNRPHQQRANRYNTAALTHTYPQPLFSQPLLQSTRPDLWKRFEISHNIPAQQCLWQRWEPICFHNWACSGGRVQGN